MDNYAEQYAETFEMVARYIAGKIDNGFYLPITDKETGEIFAYSVSGPDKPWTVAYADPAAGNQDFNKVYLLEPNTDYELIVTMHVAEAQRLINLETA
tara:strand:+ start:238 stop:531 length:294 start_codon:yes stop_codon:yes gene_type:complete